MYHRHRNAAPTQTRCEMQATADIRRGNHLGPLRRNGVELGRQQAVGHVSGPRSGPGVLVVCDQSRDPVFLDNDEVPTVSNHLLELDVLVPWCKEEVGAVFSHTLVLLEGQ